VKVHFYLDRRKGIKENLPVFLHFWHHGELLRVTTGEHCSMHDWSGKKERVKKHTAGAKEINRILDSMENELIRFMQKEKALNRSCTINDLRKNLTFLDGRKPGFFQVWDEFVDEHKKKTAWKQNTLERFRVLKNHLLSIDEKNPVGFEKMNRKFMQDFVTWQAAKGLSDAYTKKNIDQLKWFLNWASIKGYNRNLDYRRFRYVGKDKVPSAGKEIFLTPGELNRILKLNLPDGQIRVVRDAFCFACLTGLNYADLVQLEKNSIKDHKLLYTPKKTRRKLTVELMDVSLKIAEQYRQKPGECLYQLPGIQIFNKKLKEIGKAVQIDNEIVVHNSQGMTKYKKWQLLSSSASGKTFIKLGVNQGIGLEVMSELTGYAPGTLNRFYSVEKKTIIKGIRKLNSAIVAGYHKN
jgi:site-specific recombinase XerD